jgi:hypothetical protein
MSGELWKDKKKSLEINKITNQLKQHINKLKLFEKESPVLNYKKRITFFIIFLIKYLKHIGTKKLTAKHKHQKRKFFTVSYYLQIILNFFKILVLT